MTVTAEIAARVDTILNQPDNQYTRWYLEARLECEAQGHPMYAGGRCVRCRAYDIRETVDVAVNEHLPPKRRSPKIFRLRSRTAPVPDNPYQRNDPTQPCSLCEDYCSGDCASH